MRERITDIGSLASERLILQDHLGASSNLQTEVPEVQGRPRIPNTFSQDELGLFRRPYSRKAVIADVEMLAKFQEKQLTVPSFLEAGPRAELRFDPHTVRAAVVTTGGLAPGLHCVIHSIVKRHCDAYSIGVTGGRIFGVYNSFEGLSSLADNLVELNPKKTEEWLDQGGCNLGIVRYFPDEKTGDEVIRKIAGEVTKNLETNRIDILYVIGGDGSLKTAHQIALQNPTRSVIAIPKTMDNDVLWVWQSFGFDTAVEQAVRVINTLRSEAEATRRICLIELFGAESGFVAANATLASGHVDAVLIPEVFKALGVRDASEYLAKIVDHIGKTVKDEDQHAHNPHAVVVVAEGVGTALEQKGASIEGVKVEKNTFVNQFKATIEKRVVDAHRKSVPVFVNQPRHHIRAVPANAHDQIYCERLGALAVDNALAGYTGTMISQWLTEFVLVPIALVTLGKKSIPIKGMFWKQVVSNTRQPQSPAEHVSSVRRATAQRIPPG